jgi:hypothetical protein
MDEDDILHFDDEGDLIVNFNAIDRWLKKRSIDTTSQEVSLDILIDALKTKDFETYEE